MQNEWYQNRPQMGPTSTEAERLEHRVYGNGQPGDIPKLQARVQALEDFKWKALIAACVVSAFTGDGLVSVKALIGFLSK